MLKIGGLIAMVLMAGYLASVAIPKQDYFATRVGKIVSIERIDSTTEGFIDEYLNVQNDAGLQISFRVRRPLDDKKALPLVLVIGGIRTGKDAVELVDVGNDVAFLAIDYPYSGEPKPESMGSFIRAIPDIQQAFLDTPAALSIALNWALAQPWVNSQKIELVGVSLGVPFAAVAGAVDNRFSRVWLLHGGIDNGRWLDHAASKRIDTAALRTVIARTTLFLTYGNSFDTAERINAIAPRSVIFVAACNDDFVPKDALEPLSSLSHKNHFTLLWTQGLHVNPKRPAELQQLLDIVLNEVTAGSLSAGVECPQTEAS